MRAWLTCALVALGLAVSVAALPVRSQTINSDGFTIVTTSGDTLQVAVVFGGGNSFTLTFTKNGVQTAQQSFNNPNGTTFETWIATNVGPSVGSGGLDQVCVGIVQPSFNLAVHVFSTNPLSIALRTSNCDIPIPTGWWQR
jgi:hypothetical protein